MFVTLPQMSHHSSTDVDIEEDAVKENFICLIYPTNLLNCSWSFLTLQKETQFMAIIRWSFIINHHKNSIVLVIIDKYECIYHTGLLDRMFVKHITFSLCLPSICEYYGRVHRLISLERVGSQSLVLPEYNDSPIILQFNMSLHDKWTVYTTVHSLGRNSLLLPRIWFQLMPHAQHYSACIQDIRVSFMYNGMKQRHIIHL